MTWKELAEKIKALTPEQQEMRVLTEGFVNIPSWDEWTDLEVILEKPVLTC